MNKLNIKKLGLTLSTFFAIGYTLDFLWHLVLSSGSRELYLDLLKIAYLGFTGFNFASFILGLIQIYIWGWLVAAVFGWLWNFFHKEESNQTSSESA